MKTELDKNDPRVSRFTRNYRGRKPVRVSAATKCHIANYWDGGSKDETCMVNLNTGEFLSWSQVGFVKQEQGNPFNLCIGEVELNPGIAALVRITFMGKDLGFRLIVHPDDFNKFE